MVPLLQPVLAWWLLLINTVWSVIYDTLYAMVDREDDRLAGVKSTAILFGRYDVLIIAILMLVMCLLMLYVGFMWALTWPWFIGVAIAFALFVRQLITVKTRDRAHKALIIASDVIDGSAP